jgi:PHD/YefM family antitoxin component YafN of YafNO toxin-antitoxin module
MKAVHIQQGSELAELLEEIARRHEPMQIRSAGANGVLVSEADWQLIQDRLKLIPPALHASGHTACGGSFGCDEWDDGVES